MEGPRYGLDLCLGRAHSGPGVEVPEEIFQQSNGLQMRLKPVTSLESARDAGFCAGIWTWKSPGMCWLERLVGSRNDGSVDDDDNGITGLMVEVNLLG